MLKQQPVDELASGLVKMNKNRVRGDDHRSGIPDVTAGISD
jgi:hypothetical protein